MLQSKLQAFLEQRGNMTGRPSSLARAVHVQTTRGRLSRPGRRLTTNPQHSPFRCDGRARGAPRVQSIMRMRIRTRHARPAHENNSLYSIVSRKKMSKVFAYLALSLALSSGVILSKAASLSSGKQHYNKAFIHFLVEDHISLSATVG